MNTKSSVVAAVILPTLLVILPSSLSAQVQLRTPTVVGEKAKVEAFWSRANAVVSVGRSEIGSVTGTIGKSRVGVECWELIEMGTGTKQYGLGITIVGMSGFTDRGAFVFIDQEEIDPLAKALSSILKMDKSMTSLDHFQASFTTKSGFQITGYSSHVDGSMSAMVRAGSLPETRENVTYLSITELENLRNIILRAQEKINSIHK